MTLAIENMIEVSFTSLPEESESALHSIQNFLPVVSHSSRKLDRSSCSLACRAVVQVDSQIDTPKEPSRT